MKHIVLNRALQAGAVVHLTGKEFHYLCHVRRHGVGDTFRLTDGAGALLTGVIEEVGPDRCAVRLIEEAEPAPGMAAGPPLTVCQALLKGRGFDELVRQLTQLGVAEIVPVQSAHCVARLDASDVPRRLERWRRVAHEAVQQSGRVTVPRIAAPQPIDQLTARYAAGLLFHQVATQPFPPFPPTWPVPATSAAILIGPEGGLSDAEADALTAAGWNAVRLPFPVLRAETASVVAAALVLAELTR